MKSESIKLVATKKDDKLIINVNIFPTEFGYPHQEPRYEKPERCKVDK